MSDGSKKKVEEDEAVIACMRGLYVMVNLITNSCRLSLISVSSSLTSSHKLFIRCFTDQISERGV